MRSWTWTRPWLWRTPLKVSQSGQRGLRGDRPWEVSVTLQACSKVLKLSSNAPGSQKPVILAANAGGAFGAHGNGASSIEYCICLINIKPSFRVFAPWFFQWKSIKPWILRPYKSNVNPSDAVTLVLWCYSSMGNLLPHWCYSTVCTALYDMVFCIKLVWWYGRNLPPLQSSPCHGILSSGQRAKAFRRCERWINPTWLSNSAFWKKCFEQKGCQLNTQSHQPKRTPIRSQRCDVYFWSPSVQ